MTKKNAKRYGNPPLSPGSAVASIGTGNWPIIVGIAFMYLGAYIRGRFIEGEN